MGEIWKYVKVCVLAFVCMLFLGTGMQAQAAAPAQVTGLKQTNSSESYVKFSWNTVVSNNVRYKVELSADNRFSNPKTDEVSITEWSFNGLSAGSKYYLRVTAFDNSTKVYGAPSQILEVVTAPGKVECDFQQTAAKTTSITLNWKQKSGVNAYQLEYYKTGDSNAKKTVNLDNVKTYTAKNLKKDSEYYFRLYPVMKSASGYRAVSTYGPSVYGSVQPGKVSGVKGEFWSPSSNYISLSWDKRNSANGYQYQVYTASKKKDKKLVSGEVNYNSGSTSFSSSKLSKAQFVKIRVRARINLSNGKYAYGDWSNWIYTSKQPKIGIKNVSGGQKLTWNKVTGANSYTVQVSTSKDSGYKKVKTIKGNSITVKKYGKSALKKGKTYYYTVVANKKVGKKTYKGSRTYCYYMIYR